MRWWIVAERGCGGDAPAMMDDLLKERWVARVVADLTWRENIENEENGADERDWWRYTGLDHA